MERKNSEKRSDLGFRAMAFSFFYLRDRIRPPARVLERVGIKPGMTVIDYGCGPGSYTKIASELVGKEGHVYAVDIHPLAIESISGIIEAEGLTNVTPALGEGYNSGIEENSGDLIYALDMFHMIQDTDAFLRELGRIAKPDGILVIDDGHQPRRETVEKIRRSGVWTIEKETKNFLRCRPAGVSNTP